MKLLQRQIQESGIKEMVDGRLQEFKQAGMGTSHDIFKEMCFCLLTANYHAEGGLRIQREMDDEFLHLNQEQLASRLKQLGYRFPNVRASYIAQAQKHSATLKATLASLDDEFEMRDWLVENIKGLGMKEASHFLRNIGYQNLAILDKHIIRLMSEKGFIQMPKTLTPKKYFEIEKVFLEIADNFVMTAAELDLYMWYLKTGKVLK